MTEHLIKQHDQELLSLQNRLNEELKQVRQRYEMEEARLRSRHAEELRREQLKESAKAS